MIAENFIALSAGLEKDNPGIFGSVSENQTRSPDSIPIRRTVLIRRSAVSE